MKPTGATKDGEVLEQAQALSRDWNQKTRLEQIIVRHQVWAISNLPDNEYTASHADVKELLNERERLREALRDLVECCPCQNGCAPDDMTCATMKARAALNDATTSTSAGVGE